MLLLLLFTACTNTSEVKAWKAHLAEQESRLTVLQDLKANYAERRPALEATIAEAAALEQRLDLATQLRPLARPELKLFPSGDTQRLTLDAPVELCRDLLRELTPLRHLMGAWRLRVEAGRCAWESTSAPELIAWRARETTVAPWVAPPHTVLSRGVNELLVRSKSLEAQILLAEMDLGDLAHVDALPARIARGRSTEDELKAKRAPCDLEILERAVSLDAGMLLEVQSDRLVHPLEPLADERLKGLVRVTDAALTWTCAFDGGT